ncbi:MAG: 2-C-methyl-D-erythritol 4-phosphate cytidylyltransferase [Planctomycetes bacterium]|nr:2-C-methyl-D-erythritol 4-phosphate cytidylyltransferase [Planctomycetota bacterium]
MKQAKRTNRDISVIIPAAGLGKRMQVSGFAKRQPRARKESVRKPFIILKGKPLLMHIINKFAAIPRLREIIIAINPQDMEKAGKLVNIYVKKSKVKLVKGGKERRDSVARALKAVDERSQVVLVHDVARPLVNKDDIDTLIRAVRRFGAAILAVPVVDTIKLVKTGGVIEKTLKRAELWAAQTPQGFKRGILEKAYSKMAFVADKHIITDDASLAENAGYKVRIVPGSYDNMKITTIGDLEIIKEKL